MIISIECLHVFTAGVDILLTNTYQASLQGFKTHLGLDEKEGRNVFKKAVSVCKEAIQIEKNLKNS